MLTPFLASAQKNKSALKLYKLGVESFNNKDYKTADSLFTKSVELEPYPNTYFNLASTKKKLGDNCGFCNYIEMASKLGDEEASELFSSRCFTYYTTFYKKDINRYFSVVTTESCTKKRSQSFFIKIQDSIKYNFAFLDSTEELTIKVFDDFPNPDSNLNQLTGTRLQSHPL